MLERVLDSILVAWAYRNCRCHRTQQDEKSPHVSSLLCDSHGIFIDITPLESQVITTVRANFTTHTAQRLNSGE